MRRLERALWPPGTGRDAWCLLTGVAVHLIPGAVVAVMWLAAARPGTMQPGQAAPLAALVAAAVLGALIPALTAIQRFRLWLLRGLDIPPPPPAGRRTTRRGLAAWLRSDATWRQACYHLVVAPALAAAGLLAAGLWLAWLGLAGLLAHDYGNQDTSTYALLATAAGLALLAGPFTGTRLIAAVTRLDGAAAAALLGPNRAAGLRHRVETLTESRAGLVDAADAERRRIERDLHDGAQQRLVSLAMNLGLARAELGDLPEPARQVIADAHEEAKEALAELRHLVHGLHPAILEDRGLDAALSGIAARSPVPVTLRVGVAERVSPTVEAVAYFLVSEALANVAKHAGASRAEVGACRDGGVLRVTVTDDGGGGADPARGTGLAGLAKRVRSVDGTLTIDSPPGGPTTIAAELPCAL